MVMDVLRVDSGASHDVYIAAQKLLAKVISIPVSRAALRGEQIHPSFVFGAISSLYTHLHLLNSV